MPDHLLSVQERDALSKDCRIHKNEGTCLCKGAHDESCQPCGAELVAFSECGEGIVRSSKMVYLLFLKAEMVAIRTCR